MRDFYWVSPDGARECVQDVGIAAFGAMCSVLALAYVEHRFLPADRDADAAQALSCNPDEWTAAKTALLDAGYLTIADGMLMPCATWAKPELDS